MAGQPPPVTGRLPRVFISHAFAGAEEANARAVADLARAIALEGALPIAPHIYLPQFVVEASERRLAMRLCRELLAFSDEVRFFGEFTPGMVEELRWARSCGLALRFAAGANLRPASEVPK